MFQDSRPILILPTGYTGANKNKKKNVYFRRHQCSRRVINYQSLSCLYLLFVTQTYISMISVVHVLSLNVKFSELCIIYISFLIYSGGFVFRRRGWLGVAPAS